MGAEPSVKRAGSCHCGAIRFEAEGEPRFVSNCHCESCRRTTGAAFSTWVGYRDHQVIWHGERAFRLSSPGVMRGYCGACGTPLSYGSDKWPGETHLLLGVFDDPRAFTPAGDAFIEEKLDWVRPVEDS